ncbi:hypothetical protein V8C44DRAFT_258135 [Trichoderma aethiopicum]
MTCSELDSGAWTLPGQVLPVILPYWTYNYPLSAYTTYLGIVWCVLIKSFADVKLDPAPDATLPPGPLLVSALPVIQQHNGVVVQSYLSCLLQQKRWHLVYTSIQSKMRDASCRLSVAGEWMGDRAGIKRIARPPRPCKWCRLRPLCNPPSSEPDRQMDGQPIGSSRGVPLVSDWLQVRNVTKRCVPSFGCLVLRSLLRFITVLLLLPRPLLSCLPPAAA